MDRVHKAEQRRSFCGNWNVFVCEGDELEGVRVGGRAQGGAHLREGEGHQSTTNHNKVQNVPQVAEVGSFVEKQA